MKKLLLFGLIVCLVITLFQSTTFATTSTTATISIGSKKVCPNEIFNVDVKLNNNPGIVSANLTIAFSEQLELIGATNGDTFYTLTYIPPRALLAGNTVKESCQFVWSGFDITENDIKDGTILSLKFKVSKDAKIGTSHTVTVSGESGDVVDKDLNLLVLKNTATYTVGTHTYTNNADTTCNNCGAPAYVGGNTLVNEGGKWYHVVNRQKVSDTTLVQYNGVWYYVKNGVVDFSATTLVKYNNKWWYVKAGKMARDNTLVKYNGTWYHVNGGNITNSTTLVSYSGAWYYVKDGKMNTANTLVKYNGVWYHVNGGKWVKDTTLVKYNNTWYYVKDGKMNTADTLVKYNNVWYHVKGGKMANDTTLVKYSGTWYYVKNGKVDFNYTGKVLYSGKYYNVKKGVKV